MMTDDRPYIIVMTKYGPAHGLKQASGHYIACARRVGLCKYCAQDGVPVTPPDPFDVVADRLREHWGKRWFEHDRRPPERPDNVVDDGIGIHIVARDDDRRDSTVLVAFGTDPAAALAVSALVHVHNEMIGMGD